MNNRLKLLLALAAAFLAGAGCNNLDLARASDPDRTVTGTVNFRADLVLPSDAVVVVRVVDASGFGQLRSTSSQDLPLMNGPKPVPVAQVLGEQTITSPAGAPVAFSISYHADDDLLRHGLNLEARISYGGKVRLHTANAHVLTLANANLAHEVWVEPAAR